MDKRRARYEQAERTTTAEQRVKALRLEVADLRKQLFRAQESARLANEEASARAQAQRQSGEALRAQLSAAREQEQASNLVTQATLTELQHLQAKPLLTIAAQRIAARLGGKP